MLMFSLITLTIASVSVFLSFKAKEDVFKVAMGCTATLSTFLTLIVAPWILKLAILAIPILIIDRLNNKAPEESTHG